MNGDNRQGARPNDCIFTRSNHEDEALCSECNFAREPSFRQDGAVTSEQRDGSAGMDVVRQGCSSASASDYRFTEQGGSSEGTCRGRGEEYLKHSHNFETCRRSDSAENSSIVYSSPIDLLHFAQMGKRLLISVAPPLLSGVL